ncbi:MAG: transcriptional regulator [Candidatus Thiodiazotropha sp. (ex Dulcina madagascariensis)]|nr:transcriptional regulator [Candidatus Thiodiazotropha sp. (ex Dulcina madagascariensis)]MCU7927334.1 transcriptional regulator [Candidatus Thiodiazotropha sp. (ex Dulcina madagascariensis)]
MTQLALIDAYQTFLHTARSLVVITNEEDHAKALGALEQILESAGDTRDDALNPLINMLSHAIETYESKDEEVMAFVTEAQGLPADIALLRTLMRQYKLTGSDLPEIGGKAMVSKVLKGERALSRAAIEQLSARFGLRPSLFFAEPVR